MGEVYICCMRYQTSLAKTLLISKSWIAKTNQLYIFKNDIKIKDFKCKMIVFSILHKNKILIERLLILSSVPIE